MSAVPSILLVEDNEQLAAGLRHNLELEGYGVRWARDGPSGLEAARKEPPDLMILDLMMPGLDGFELLATLRKEGFDSPVLILSARDGEADKVRGFRMDATQYVTKPFGLLELLERVRSILRLQAGTPSATARERITFGRTVVDLRARTVHQGDEEISLTPKAFELLLALVRNEGRVMSRQDLLRDVWGHRATVVTRTVDSHVSELRTKLERDPADPDHIHTVWKVGYRFES